jgi:hypothetical protein
MYLPPFVASERRDVGEKRVARKQQERKGENAPHLFFSKRRRNHWNVISIVVLLITLDRNGRASTRNTNYHYFTSGEIEDLYSVEVYRGH